MKKCLAKLSENSEMNVKQVRLAAPKYAESDAAGACIESSHSGTCQLSTVADMLWPRATCRPLWACVR